MSNSAKIPLAILAFFILTLNFVTFGLVVKLYATSNSFWKAHEETHGNLVADLPNDFTDKVDDIAAHLTRIDKENVALNELRVLPDPDVDGVLGEDDLCPWEMYLLRLRQGQGQDRKQDGDLDRNGCNDDTYWMELDVASERYHVEDEDGNPIEWPAPTATLRGADTETATDDDHLWWYWNDVRRIDGKELKPFGLQCRGLRGNHDVTLGEMATAPSTSYGHCAVFEGEPELVPSKYLKKK